MSEEFDYGSSVSVFDFETNYSMLATNMTNNSSMNLISEVKMILDTFLEDSLVLGEPANTVIISIYCVLVTVAG